MLFTDQEVRDLIEVLKPFSDMSAKIPSTDPDTNTLITIVGDSQGDPNAVITYGDLRRAAAARELLRDLFKPPAKKETELPRGPDKSKELPRGPKRD